MAAPSESSSPSPTTRSTGRSSPASISSRSCAPPPEATSTGGRSSASRLVDNQDEFGIPVAAEGPDGSYPQDGRGYPTDEATIVGWSKDCFSPTRYGYVYRNTAGQFHWLDDPANPPADVATTTTLDGETVPFVVRWERGVINRFIYSIATLAPTDEATPLEPDNRLWNRRLVFSFDGGVAIGHTQGTTSTGSMLSADLLGKGYGVLWSSGTRTSTHYDLQVGGETALMIKERFIERHGVPDYTVAVGGSGGAIQQYVYGQNHPGLIDAAIPQYSYSDMVTQTIHVGECELLEHFFDVVDKDNPKWKDPEVRQQIIGLNGTNFPKNLSQGEIEQWNGLYALFAAFGYQVMDRDPASPAPALMECKPGWLGLTPLVLNPTFTDVDDIDKLAQGTEGVEWTHFDDMRQVYGTGPDGFARRPWDNVGVQYGLVALRNGTITPAEFLDLNANVGGWKQSSEMVTEGFPYVGDLTPQNFDPWSSRNAYQSPDGGDTPAKRTEGNRAAMKAVYRTGMQFQGDIDIPIIDWRHYLEDELDMHHSHQSFATRQRMLNADGNADNQVIWFTDARPAVQFDQTPMAFEVIDEWMANIEAHPERGVAGNKPARCRRLVLQHRRQPPRLRRARLGRRHRRPARRRLHPALPDLLDVTPPGRRTVRGRHLEVPDAADPEGDRPRRLRQLAPDLRPASAAERDLPRRRLRLHQRRRRRTPSPPPVTVSVTRLDDIDITTAPTRRGYGRRQPSAES